MWVTSWANTVWELSPTGARLGPFAAGSVPTAIAFDGTNMWVTNANTRTITELWPIGASAGSFPAGYDALGIAFDGTNCG